MKIMVDRGDGVEEATVALSIDKKGNMRRSLARVQCHLSWQGSECTIEHAVVNEQVLESVH